MKVKLVAGGSSIILEPHPSESLIMKKHFINHTASIFFGTSKVPKV